MKSRSVTDQMYGSLNLAGISKSKDLRSKIFFVILMLIFYRFGTYISLPGINTSILESLSNAHAGGVLGMFNMFTGGALGRMSIFALNIMPYITASIIMQLLTVISADVAAMRKEGESGKRKLNQYTKYLTIILAIFQGYGITVGVEGMQTNQGRLVEDPGFMFRFVAVTTLLGGTMLVVWMSEQINLRGIGNGSSLIIFSGIVSGLPASLATFFEMGRTGALSTPLMFSITVFLCLIVAVIVYFEKAQRRIIINYPKRQIGNKMYGGDSTHLPLKLNTSGVIPAIFASSLLLFPATIAGFATDSSSSFLQEFVAEYLMHGKPLFILLYAVIIGFFCFFYTSIIFNTEETAENLRKNGGVVLGRRPGVQTAEYFDFVLTRITVLGAAYMIFICVFPEILISKFSVPFYLGGTSVLIVVNVVIDLFSQIQTHLLSTQYEALLKKSKFKGANL